jgi:phage regulator Rha-like protein
MKNLLQIINNEPRVSHRVVAENTNNAQRSMRLLIDEHLSDFQEFGTVEVFIADVQTKGGVQKQKTFWLNEAQATLLMTYLRNSEVVRKFKKWLVKEFFSLRETVNTYELKGRIGGLVAANNRYREELQDLRHDIGLMSLQIEKLKQLPPPQNECVLPHKMMGKNSLLDFIGSVQKQQQCFKMMFEEMEEMYRGTNYLKDRFLDLYPEANPKANYNKEIHIHL